MTRPNIGFIGLGLMGRPMAERLLDCGYSLTVVGNRSRTAIDAVVARGAVEVPTARALAEASDIVMLCMGTSEQVESRIYGDDGVLAAARPGLTVIDFGTSLPASTRAIAAAMAEKGAHYLDAPLGRTPTHAKDGLLNIMCAGDKAAYNAAEPVLKDLGENVFHLGASGAGHTVKLINNFFGMTTACAMSEAFVMADAAGVSRETLYAVMSAGPLRSGMMDFVKGYAVDGRANDLAFSIANGRKDIGYYRAMAEEMAAPSAISGAADGALGAALNAGWGDKMVSQMVDFLAERASDKEDGDA